MTFGIKGEGFCAWGPRHSFFYAASITKGPGASQCLNDPRFIRIIGQHNGLPVCQMAGTGIGDPVLRDRCGTTPSYPAGISFLKTFDDGHEYCVWGPRAGKHYFAATTRPPDNCVLLFDGTQVKSILVWDQKACGNRLQ